MVENSTQNGGSNPDSQIPRPHGTAGTHFSIQEAMGLAGSQKRYETYKTIQVRVYDPLLVTSHAFDVEQRNLRDLTLNARINWEVPWAQVPAREKAKLFEVVSTDVKDYAMRMLDKYLQARDQHPFLARFERDWATEEIVKQFVKNKRKNHYANGWLEVPDKYTYLKQNSKKRNPAGSWSKKGLTRTTLLLGDGTDCTTRAESSNLGVSASRSAVLEE
jgi:hypothetical protein